MLNQICLFRAFVWMQVFSCDLEFRFNSSMTGQANVTFLLLIQTFDSFNGTVTKHKTKQIVQNDKKVQQLIKLHLNVIQNFVNDPTSV